MTLNGRVEITGGRSYASRHNMSLCAGEPARPERGATLMKLEGSQVIGADRQTVWAALNDAAVLQACIPGCQSLEKTSETGFEAVVKQKVGPVSATFTGVVELTNLNPPESYTISGEGKGGAAGFAKGSADVRLEETAEGTVLNYSVEAKIGGKLAQLGARLIDGFAKGMADKFFANFKQQVESAGDQPSEDVAEGGETGGEPGGEAPKKGLWKRVFG